MRFTSTGIAPPANTPIWRDGRFGFEVIGLLRSRKFWSPELTSDKQHGVLLVPGLLAGDWSLATLAAWLDRCGYRTAPSGIRSNIDCSQRHLQQLVDRVARLAEQTGARVTIVGHSRRHPGTSACGMPSRPRPRGRVSRRSAAWAIPGQPRGMGHHRDHCVSGHREDPRTFQRRLPVGAVLR